MKAPFAIQRLLILLIVVATTAVASASGFSAVLVDNVNVLAATRSVREPTEAARSVGEAAEPDISVAGAALGNTPDRDLSLGKSTASASANGSAAEPSDAAALPPEAPATTAAVSQAAASPSPTAAPQTTAAPSTTAAAEPQPVAPTTTTTNAPTTTTTSTTTTSTTTTSTTTTSTTTTTAAPVTEFRVGTDGRVRGGRLDGRSIQDALRDARPGDVFLMASGQHQPLSIDGVNGSSSEPIEVRAGDRSNPPTFSSGDYSRSAGVEVVNSSHVVVADVKIRRSLWGVRVEASSNVVLAGLDVTDIGQEGVRIMDRSSWVTVRDSVISGTGKRSGTASNGEPYSSFGEGIYVGTGSGDRNDDVDHVSILDNEIFGTSSEAIDIKAPTKHIDVIGNSIHDIRTKTSGAIVVHVRPDYSDQSSGIRINRNVIRNISTDSGYRDGVAIVIGSSAEIDGNIIENAQHYGIRIEDGGSQGGNIQLSIRNNSFSGIGYESVWQASDKATVSMSGNSGA